MPENLDLKVGHDSDTVLNKMENWTFSATTGELLHLSVRNQPDVSSAVNFFGLQIHVITQRKAQLLKRISRGASGYRNLSINYSCITIYISTYGVILEANVDSDLSGENNFRKSTIGSITAFNGKNIS